MRVLFWSNAFWPEIGGVQVFAARLLPALQERGYEIMVVTPQTSSDQSTEAQYKGVLIHRFPFMHIDSYTNIDQLMKVQQQVANLKRTFAPDLIHINSISFVNFFHLETARACPAPVLVTLHLEISPSEDTRPDTFIGQTLRTADWVTGVSSSVLSSVRGRVPELVPRSSVIYNGLDIPDQSPSPLPFDPPRLLCLGRLAPQKGFDTALRALVSIADRFPRVSLIIAGDGPERPKLEQQIAELDLTDRVELVGWVAPDQVPSLMNTATVVVMPSRWEEAFGLVALEAALMDRPIVATRVDGLSEVVVHQETGLLVEPESPESLAAAIGYLLDHPQIATQMGQAARLRAQGEFSWERHVDAYDGLYRQLVMNWRWESAAMRLARSDS